MDIKVHISPLLSHHTNHPQVAEVSGNTVGECLKHLVEQFPKLKLFDKNGELQSYLLISFNKEVICQKELDKPVKDGDELFIMLVDIGG